MRLLPKEIKAEREQRTKNQGFVCALCGAAIAETDIVHLDHDHDTGSIRGSLHGTCNLLLGKIERGLKRGIRSPDGFLQNVGSYIEKNRNNPDEMTHPSHLTKDEKKAKAKRRAKRRAKISSE